MNRRTILAKHDGIAVPGVRPVSRLRRRQRQLVATWKLVGFKVQASDTKEEKDALGPKLQGRLILTATGYITGFRVVDGRKPGRPTPSAPNSFARWRLGLAAIAWKGKSYSSRLIHRRMKTIPARSTCRPMCLRAISSR
jgi:hypothetical protein